MTKYEKRRQTIFQSLRPNELSKAGYEPITNYEERIWTFETTKVGYEPITNYEERIWTPVWCLTFEPFPTPQVFRTGKMFLNISYEEILSTINSQHIY